MYLGEQVGILYATNAYKACMVTVPWQEGASGLINLDNLEVLHWVDQLGPNLFAMSPQQFWKTYNVGCDCKYTFFRENLMSYCPLNALIQEIAGIIKNEMDVTGNVLVVNHVQGKKDKLLNCVEENIPHIDRIIKR
jgi:hypothetical protein